MNASIQTRTVPAARPAAAVVVPAPRPEPRNRDFGIGYGSSSGYFSQRRYAGNATTSRFRCS
ncbi:MAG: hypothetical protein ACTHZI_11745 [Luteimonas sp.]